MTSNDNNIELMKVKLLGSPLWEWFIGGLVVWFLVTSHVPRWIFFTSLFFLSVFFSLAERVSENPALGEVLWAFARVFSWLFVLLVMGCSLVLLPLLLDRMLR